MEITLAIISIICLILGIAGSILPALPGPPLSYLGLLLINWSGYATFSNSTLIIYAIITIFVTVIDFALAPYLTKKFGGSKAANYGATIGLILGFFIPYGLGIIVGPFIGALLGELLITGSNFSKSINVAMGAFLSFFIGTGIKLILSIIIIIHVIAAVI